MTPRSMGTRRTRAYPALAPASAPTEEAGGHDHTGTLVLTNRTLWDLITGFMTGYPRAVYDFVRDLNPEQVLNRSFQSMSYCWHQRQRVLPDLAVAANNPAMFRLLYTLAKQPGHQRDPMLRLTEVMRCAVLLMRMALHRDDPDLAVIEWVYTYTPRKLDPITENDLRFHVERGDLDVVKWLYEHGCKITQRLVDVAAICGHAHVFRYLFQKSNKRCAFTAVHEVVKNGDMDVLNLIFAKQKVDIRRIALNSAVEFGRMKIVTLLVESIPGVVTQWTIERASRYGHLDVLRYLLENLVGECTVQLMTVAAEYGHLDVVRFLYENRTEGCSPDALERAARNCHLDVVKFPHDKYGLKCSRNAMTTPAIRWRWEMLEFLQTNNMLSD